MTRGVAARYLGFCLGLLMLGGLANANAADQVRFCGFTDVKQGAHCLVRRGIPEFADQSVELSLLRLDLQSGTALPPKNLTAEAQLQGGRLRLPMVVEAGHEPLAVEVVVVVQQPRISRRLELIKEQLTRVANALTTLNGSEFHLLSYGGFVENLSESDGTKRSAKEAIAALKPLDAKTGSLVLHDAVVAGLNTLTQSATASRPKILVILSDGDNTALDNSLAPGLWSLLGKTVKQLDLAVDILHLPAVKGDADNHGYDVLARSNGGVVRLVESDAALAGQVTSLIQELQGHYMVRVSVKAAPEAVRSGRYKVQLRDTGGNPLMTDATFLFAAAALAAAAPGAAPPPPSPSQSAPPPLPAAGSSSTESIVLGILMLLLIGLVSMAVRSAFKIIRKPASRASGKHQRAQLVAWLVPLTGPSAFKTLEIPAAGLSVGNTSRFNLYVGMSESAPMCYQISYPLDEDNYCLFCPPNGSVLVNNIQRTEKITLTDNDELTIGDTRIVYKCCDLDT